MSKYKVPTCTDCGFQVDLGEREPVSCPSCDGDVWAMKVEYRIAAEPCPDRAYDEMRERKASL